MNERGVFYSVLAFLLALVALALVYFVPASLEGKCSCDFGDEFPLLKQKICDDRCLCNHPNLHCEDPDHSYKHIAVLLMCISATIAALGVVFAALFYCEPWYDCYCFEEVDDDLDVLKNSVIPRSVTLSVLERRGLEKQS